MHTLSRTSSPSPERIRIGYIGGGSRAWATTLIGDLAQCPDLEGEVRLYDVDYESAKRNERLGNALSEREEAASEWQYTAVRDLAEALEGVDFVVLSTQDPPSETMAYDLDLPQRYGIYQTVGDTVGPGGVLRAMRAIPQYREIAAMIRTCCPDAWVLNFTNPMTVCTRTLYEEFPQIKAVGICHEVYGTQDFLAELVAKHGDSERPSREEIDVNVKGINHFTWIDEARWNGVDLMPIVSAEAQTRDPPTYAPGEMADERYYTNHRDVTFDLYSKFGIMPAAGDRHLVEFVPWYLDIDEPEQIHRWGIRLTPSDHRIVHWPDGEERQQELLDDPGSFEFSSSGEEMVELMLALLGHRPLKTNANVPNRGQIPDLPDGAVVETNVLFTGDAATPLTAGSLPRQVRNIVTSHIHNQETIVEAGFVGDLDQVFQAFLNEPLVAIDPVDARDLFVELIEAQRSYFGAWDLDDAAVLDRADVVVNPS